VFEVSSFITRTVVIGSKHIPFKL